MAALIAERDRVCADPIFRRSPVMARLLSYLVDQHAANDGAGPKSYAIGVDVLGRAENFDPATDSYPRVMVGRLRALLDQYYRQNPTRHRLVIPTGGYAIMFQSASDDPQPAPAPDDHSLAATSTPADPANPRGKKPPTSFDWKTIFAAAVAALVIVALGIAWMRTPPPAAEPQGVFTLVIEPGDSTREPAVDDAVHTAHQLLIDMLVRFDNMSVQTGLKQLTYDQDKAAYLLMIDASPGPEGAPQIMLQLQHLDGDQPIWTRRGSWSDDPARNELFLESVSSELASDYGVLVRHQLLKARDNYTPGIQCLSQAAEFRLSRDAGQVAPLERCLTASIDAFPERPALYRDALSFVLYAKAELDPPQPQTLARARQLADEAFERAGLDSATANFAMARSHFFRGDCAGGARQLRAAVEKNPANGERLAFGGTYLFMCRDPDALAMLNRAVALDGDRSSLALVVLAFYRIREEDGEAALALLDRVVPSHRQEPAIELARAAALHDLGRTGESAAVMTKLRRQIRADANTPAEKFLGRFISNPRTIAVMAKEMRKRSLQP